MLVTAGANVFAKNKHGNRPLEYAKDHEVETFLAGKL